MADLPGIYCSTPPCDLQGINYGFIGYRPPQLVIVLERLNNSRHPPHLTSQGPDGSENPSTPCGKTKEVTNPCSPRESCLSASQGATDHS